MYRLGLANPVDPGHGLDVDLGVPIRVVQDASVGRLEIDAQAARPGGEQEHEGLAAGSAGTVRGKAHADVGADGRMRPRAHQGPRAARALHAAKGPSAPALHPYLFSLVELLDVDHPLNPVGRPVDSRVLEPL